MERKWLYDIMLNEKIVGDQGDGEFDTKAEAQADADDYCISELCKEYDANPRDFKIECYQAAYQYQIPYLSRRD